jgi:hypothetical protein
MVKKALHCLTVAAEIPIINQFWDTIFLRGHSSNYEGFLR